MTADVLAVEGFEPYSVEPHTSYGHVRVWPTSTDVVTISPIVAAAFAPVTSQNDLSATGWGLSGSCAHSVDVNSIAMSSGFISAEHCTPAQLYNASRYHSINPQHYIDPQPTTDLERTLGNKTGVFVSIEVGPEEKAKAGGIPRGGMLH